MYKNKNVISEHAPKAKKPLTSSELGFFLAGIIDGNGHISKKGYLAIVFHEKDISVAYYLKKALKQGYIRKVKNKRAYSFVCQALETVNTLILDKLKRPRKIKQFNHYSMPKLKYRSSFKDTKRAVLTPSYPKKDQGDCLLKNHWLAGFIQTDGNFQIKTLRRLNNVESQIVVKIDQNDAFLLEQVKQCFSGYISHHEPWASHIYSSTGFLSAIALIDYLDRYQVMGATLTAYWLWRKAYLILQNKKDNEHAGIYKLIRLKRSLTILRGEVQKENSKKDIGQNN